MINVQPVILCGGSGTRLWPLSRSGFPKQFLAFNGTHSLFQAAVARLLALASSAFDVQPCLVVTNEEHRFLALEQLREMKLGESTLLLEPSARNTAAALTLAALQAARDHVDPVLVASPSDQFIGNESGYLQCLEQAIQIAVLGPVVILGIKPDRAETGYGYIRFDKNVLANAARVVQEFVEKPDMERARKYLASGDYAWNSGVFVLKASVWLKAIRKFRPDILLACEAAWAVRTNDQVQSGFNLIRPEASSFALSSAESIDYAVMEKCPGSLFPIQMLELNADWSDLGSWDAVWKVGQTDAQGNVCKGDVLLDQATDNFIHSTNRLVSVVGVNDLVVVETADAVLIANKLQSQNVKNIVAQLERSGRSEHSLHRKVHRRWGWYDSIDEGENFKVNRIKVNPGTSLSLQRHYHRAEHWIVVKGTAEVTCGETVKTLTENQSTYIPVGEIHRLTNPGVVDLEIIEIQSGTYFGEDDIVRIQENYERAE